MGNLPDTLNSTLNETISDISTYTTPTIMTELAEFLKSKGHQCVKIEGIINHTFIWCQKDVCNMPHDMDTADKKQLSYQPQNEYDYPQIMNDLTYLLKNKNHTCPIITTNYGPVFNWCCKDECQESIIRQNEIKRQQEDDALANRLRREGHTCIIVLCTAPPVLDWCHNKVCINAKK